jgi:hypothetical protein
MIPRVETREQQRISRLCLLKLEIATGEAALPRAVDNIDALQLHGELNA